MKAIRNLCVVAMALAFWGCTSWPTGTSAVPMGGDPAIAAGSESYTVLLHPPFLGPDHVRDATDGKRRVEDATKWSGVYIVHEERSSSVYLGRYSEANQATTDLERVRKWKMPDGEQPFSQAIVTKLAGESVGRPEWDLGRATDPNWYYTVVIAEFHNVPEEGYTNRKQLAAANCEDLRRQGVEAYYFHGPAKSFVTIGAFPVSAFKMETLPNGSRRDVFASEALMKIMHDWPCLAVNGYKARFKGSNEFEGTYVSAISEYRSAKVAPAPEARPAGRTIPDYRQPQPR
jgi:hypothetical protein